MVDFFKNIKVIIIATIVLAGIVGGCWWYVQGLKNTIDDLTARNVELIMEALDTSVQHNLDMDTLKNKNDSLTTLNIGLTSLEQKTITVTEYVEVYKNNPVNNGPCLRSEWMHTYNKAVEATYDGRH